MYILYSGLLLHPMRECSLKFKFPQIFLSMYIGWGFYPVSTIQHWHARILANKYLHGTPGACISLISLPNTCLRNSKTFRAFSFCFLQLKIKITRAPITTYLVFNYFRGLHKLYYCAVDFFFKLCTVQYMKTSFKILNSICFWVQTSMELFYQARTFDKKMKLLPKTQKLRVDQMFLKIILQ